MWISSISHVHISIINNNKGTIIVELIILLPFWHSEMPSFTNPIFFKSHCRAIRARPAHRRHRRPLHEGAAQVRPLPQALRFLRHHPAIVEEPQAPRTGLRFCSAVWILSWISSI